MIRYIIKRLLYLIPVILCVSFLIFALMDLTPGTVVDSMIPSDATPEMVEEIYAQYDLDKPMVYRYAKYMLQFVQGDLGKSDISGENILRMYLDRLPNTLLLAVSSLFVAAVLAIPMGIRAARHAGTLTDNLTTVATLVGMSMPSFWLGLLLLFLFSFKLRLFPASGNDGFLSYILPAVCNGLTMMAGTTRQTRAAMLEILHADFLRTARSKGVPEKRVIWKHALGNAMIPILTTLGSNLSSSLAGSVVIESVFAWPGVGRLTAEAIMSRDVKLACGAVIMTTILYVIMQLIVDLAYAFVDPRIKARYIRTRKTRRKAA
ncbi:MAG: ABC transporter permease [Lachnospiraceae bacterium]|nr:ABC transporter permease [Lachnospiraceae bacterium]MCI9151690.1 ABC transporter permease [Lachnospiraceae bacterium]